MPYLRMYEEESGSREVDLLQERTLIGRQGGLADIRIAHPTVSRAHAVIYRIQGRYFIEDANSRCGTFVNGARVLRKTLLRHGSSIQLGDTVLEFREDDKTRQIERKRVRSLHGIRVNLLQHFSRMPASIRIRYRSLAMRPGDVFATGDTILVADGGILIPSGTAVEAGSCIELEITAPGREPKRFAGEILVTDQDASPPMMGVKLHNAEKDKRYQEAVMNCRRGSWILAQEGTGFDEFS